MLIKLLTQFVLASVVFQWIPPDMGALEKRALFPDAPPRSALVMATASLETAARLPRASDAALAPVKVRAASMGVVVSAQSALVIDRDTRTVLYEKNRDMSRSIGSMTKLMTAYVFLQGNPDLNATASLEAVDVRLGGVQHLSLGDPIRVRDMLWASLIASDNSATAALVRLSGLREGDFVSRMNEEAAGMGMQQTTFTDPTGLSADNRSIVHDVVLMLDRILQHPVIKEATTQVTADIVSVSGRVYHLETTDELLNSFLNRFPYRIVGGKTGFLPEAGYSLGTIFSENNGHEIIVVVLGSETNEGRFQDVKSLAAWAYQTFDWQDQQTL